MTRILVLLACLLTLLSSINAATLPANFTETAIPGLSSPTAMAIAPDGRIFVCQQGGALRVIKNGALLPQPFMTLTVDPAGERGLLGIAFDPNRSVRTAAQPRQPLHCERRRRRTGKRNDHSRTQQSYARFESQWRRDPFRPGRQALYRNRRERHHVKLANAWQHAG
jgi:glucose/arabinose dehydrogenase